MALKERLLEAKSCMFVDDEDIEDMMAPFVDGGRPPGRQDQGRVQGRVLQEGRRTAPGVDQPVKFTGWTAEERLADYRPVEG